MIYLISSKRYSGSTTSSCTTPLSANDPLVIPDFRKAEGGDSKRYGTLLRASEKTRGAVWRSSGEAYLGWDKYDDKTGMPVLAGPKPAAAKRTRQACASALNRMSAARSPRSDCRGRQKIRGRRPAPAFPSGPAVHPFGRGRGGTGQSASRLPSSQARCRAARSNGRSP